MEGDRKRGSEGERSFVHTISASKNCSTSRKVRILLISFVSNLECRLTLKFLVLNIKSCDNRVFKRNWQQCRSRYFLCVYQYTLYILILFIVSYFLEKENINEDNNERKIAFSVIIFQISHEMQYETKFTFGFLFLSNSSRRAFFLVCLKKAGFSRAVTPQH